MLPSPYHQNPPKISSLFFPSCDCTQISSRMVFTRLGESDKILLHGWIQLHSWLLDMICHLLLFFLETEVEEDTAEQGKTTSPPPKSPPWFYIFWILKMNQTSQKWWKAISSGLSYGTFWFHIPEFLTFPQMNGARMSESLNLRILLAALWWHLRISYSLTYYAVNILYPLRGAENEIRKD